MNKWQEIYDNNLKLDKIFQTKYENDPDIYKKNCLELLTELGELANETKCFKYWSVKEPDKNKVLDEYADCITMSLTFMGTLGLSLEKLPKPQNFTNILELFNYLFQESTNLFYESKSITIQTIFVNILQIKNFINITETELQTACINKQKIILERLNSNY